MAHFTTAAKRYREGTPWPANVPLEADLADPQAVRDDMEAVRLEQPGQRDLAEQRPAVVVDEQRRLAGMKLPRCIYQA